MLLNTKTLNNFMDQLRSERDAKEAALGMQTTTEVIEILKSKISAVQVEQQEETIEEVLEAERQKVVFECDRKVALVKNLLTTDSIKTLYGNQTVGSRLELIDLVESIPTGEEDSLLILTIDAYDCNETQALTKIALALNIRNTDNNCWFHKQLEVIKHNYALLEDPEQIAEKYPKVYSKIKKGDRTQRKYYMFLMDAFMAKLERRGLFFDDKNTSLITAESFKTVSKTLFVRRDTAQANMNDLHNFGFTRKLTDDQLRKMSPVQYGEIKVYQRKMQHIASHIKTITNYELIKWDDELLAYAEEQITNCKSKKLTHKAQNANTMNAAGYTDTVSKIDNQKLSAKDKENMKALKNWAREKYKAKGRQFITDKELKERFNDSEVKNPVFAGKKKQEVYRSLLIEDLDLVAIYATKDCRMMLQSLRKTTNKKDWQGVSYQSHVYVKREVYEANTKIFSLVK